MYIESYIKDVVDRLVKKYKTSDPLEIIKLKKNITFEISPLNENINGYYKYISDKRQILSVNSNLWGNERQFTLFHELGHSVFRHKDTLLLNSPTTKNMKKEYEADLFATYFFLKHNCINQENIDNIVMPKRASELAHKFLPYIF